jgi:sensor histidine kinase YesM
LKINELSDEGLKVIIKDNGIGIRKSQMLKKSATTEKASHSISNIKERIKLINKQAGYNKVELKINNIVEQKDEGTKIELSFYEKQAMVLFDF